MFKVAIVDDDKTALMISSGAIEGFFRDKNIDFKLFSYSNPKTFVSCIKEECFDLAFLDIDMPEINGLNVAEQIQSFKKDMIIIFLSQREDLVFECLKFHPFGFIRKSKLIEDFSLMMNQLYNSVLNVENDSTKLEISDKTKTITFKINEIVYIEGDRNYQKVCLKDGNVQNVRIPLGSLEEKLKAHGFIRIHKGYLLNYLFIRSMRTDEVLLTTGTSLPISAKRKDEIMKEYLEISRKNSTVII